MDSNLAGPSIEDDPEAIREVILRSPCPDCGCASFGFCSVDVHDGVTVTRIAEYHYDACPVLARGAFVIAVMPSHAIDLAGYYTRG